jgi:DNA-binding protein YbaB
MNKNMIQQLQARLNKAQLELEAMEMEVSSVVARLK